MSRRSYTEFTLFSLLFLLEQTIRTIIFSVSRASSWSGGRLTSVFGQIQGRKKHRRTRGHVLARALLDKKRHLKLKWGNFEI